MSCSTVENAGNLALASAAWLRGSNASLAARRALSGCNLCKSARLCPSVLTHTSKKPQFESRQAAQAPAKLARQTTSQHAVNNPLCGRFAFTQRAIHFGQPPTKVGQHTRTMATTLPAPPTNDENMSPTTPPRPPVQEVEDPPLATPHTSGETDILDESLACLEGSLRSADVDETALSLATALAEKGDDASIMRAHAVLSECGVAMGLWDLNKLPTKAPGDARPVGAMYSTAEVPRPRYYNATQIQAKETRRVSLDLANASTTSLKNAPSLSGE